MNTPKHSALIAITAVAVAGLAWSLLRPEAPPPALSEPPAPKAAVVESPTKTLTDGPVLFQRAFWKKATAADKILHAERREWGEGEGLKKWQWFLVVEPSPELLKYLREDNAFGLTPAKDLPAVEGAPDWFAYATADFETMRTHTGTMRVFFHRTKPLIYATAFGAGFTAGAKLPAAKVALAADTTQPAGRIPRTAPPTPSK